MSAEPSEGGQPLVNMSERCQRYSSSALITLEEAAAVFNARRCAANFSEMTNQYVENQTAIGILFSTRSKCIRYMLQRSTQRPGSDLASSEIWSQVVSPECVCSQCVSCVSSCYCILFPISYYKQMLCCCFFCQSDRQLHCQSVCVCVCVCEPK